MTLGGSNFRDARDPAGDRWLQLTINGKPEVEADIISISDTHFSFVAPGHVPGQVTFGILDRETGLLGELPSKSFEYR